jgi:hypothetical protein
LHFNVDSEWRTPWEWARTHLISRDNGQPCLKLRNSVIATFNAVRLLPQIVEPDERYVMLVFVHTQHVVGAYLVWYEARGHADLPKIMAQWREHIVWRGGSCDRTTAKYPQVICRVNQQAYCSGCGVGHRHGGKNTVRERVVAAGFREYRAATVFQVCLSQRVPGSSASNDALQTSVWRPYLDTVYRILGDGDAGVPPAATVPME